MIFDRKIIFFLFGLGLVALSGCLNSEPPPPPGQQIENSTEKKEAISQETTNEFENDTGVEVTEIIIKPKGSLGGEVIINIENTSDKECGGLIINVDLLSETKKVIVSLGLKAPKSIPPSGKETLKEGYIGKEASTAVVTELTCDYDPWQSRA